MSATRALTVLRRVRARPNRMPRAPRPANIDATSMLLGWVMTSSALANELAPSGNPCQVAQLATDDVDGDTGQEAGHD